MNKRCVIVSACPVSGALRPYCRPGDTVIACDAGYRNLEALGVKADLLVGDYDSAPRPEGEVILLPHEKDDTDTHYAAKLALEGGAREIVLLGALGGLRLDHTLASIATGLFLAKAGVNTLLADEHTELRFLLGGQTLTLAGEGWQYLSLFPLEGEIRGLSTRGAYYELENASLQPAFPLGVSNEFARPTVTLSLKEGSLAVLLTKER